MMETRLIPKKFLKLIKNLADENRNYKKIFGNVFWLEVVKEKNYSWFNLRLNSIRDTKNIIDSGVFLDGIIDEANVQNVINKNIFAVVTNVQIQNPDISIFYMIKDKKTGLYMYSDDFWDTVGYEERDFADFISKKMKQIEITIRYE